jgi:uncharacterized protein YlxP (DUF503 family)
LVVCTLVCHLIIPGCRSLKEKRSQIKPFISRLHREFNISIAEIEKQDIWDETVIACACVSSQHQFAEKSLSQVLAFMEKYWKDLQIVEHHME